jgi:hypothetical protein
LVEDGGEGLAGGEVDNLHPAEAGVALVPRALAQRHLCRLETRGASPLLLVAARRRFRKERRTAAARV